jgi:ADP-ribose pyrophosphatase
MELYKLPKSLNRKQIYSSDWLDLNLDKVLLSSGKIINDYHVIESKFDSVVILMLNENEEICFIKSPRYTTQTIELELPAGGISKDETIEEAGVREVLEETGFQLKNAKHIYSFHPSNSISNQKSHIIFGSCDSKMKIKPFDTDEVYEVIWLNAIQVKEHIKKNEIKDGYALISLLYYFAFIINDGLFEVN